MVELEGIVLHSSDIDVASRFYEALLRVQFKEEKHGKGPRHYASHLENGLLVEIYPLPKAKNPPTNPDLSDSSRVKMPALPNHSDPSLIFRVKNLEVTLDKMKDYTKGKVEILTYGAKIYDPDGRSIYLHILKD